MSLLLLFYDHANAALTMLLRAALVGAGLPAGAVYGYRPAKFNEVPALIVSSENSERLDETLDNAYLNHFFYKVAVFVPYAVADSTWGPDDAEDAIDLIEKMIADVVMDCRSTSYWDYIQFAQRTTIDDILIGGEQFKRETIRVKVTKYQAVSRRIR